MLQKLDPNFKSSGLLVSMSSSPSSLYLTKAADTKGSKWDTPPVDTNEISRMSLDISFANVTLMKTPSRNPMLLSSAKPLKPPVGGASQKHIKASFKADAGLVLLGSNAPPASNRPAKPVKAKETPNDEVDRAYADPAQKPG